MSSQTACEVNTETEKEVKSIVQKELERIVRRKAKKAKTASDRVGKLLPHCQNENRTKRSIRKVEEADTGSHMEAVEENPHKI
jgi:hypothetical protein